MANQGIFKDYIPKVPSLKMNQSQLMLVILMLIMVTNILTLYTFISPQANLLYSISRSSKFSTWESELNSTRDEVILKDLQIDDLRNELKSAKSLIENLQLHLNMAVKKSLEVRYDDLIDDLNDEAKRAAKAHQLPLGSSPKIGKEILFSYGAGCLKYKQELNKYMSYQVGGECPMDDHFAQTLMLMGCEPLPRRRCYPKSPLNYVEPTPIPKSLWSTPSDNTVIWDPYTCKNYTCLTQRWHYPGTYDCSDCFDLGGKESHRWTYDKDLDFGINEVLGLKPPGTIRIGLDIGGGSGTFAARLMEKNVTIITTSMNFDAPFNSFIASRGLLSMHITISHRLPFFENTLDIVHSMHVLSHWIPDIMLEFILYDVYRILRPGGLFWLDHFFCFGSQLNATYGPMFERLGFKILRWDTGRKLDRGIDRDEVYLSVVFEKPMS